MKKMTLQWQLADTPWWRRIFERRCHFCRTCGHAPNTVGVRVVRVEHLNQTEHLIVWRKR